MTRLWKGLWCIQNSPKLKENVTFIRFYKPANLGGPQVMDIAHSLDLQKLYQKQSCLKNIELLHTFPMHWFPVLANNGAHITTWSARPSIVTPSNVHIPQHCETRCHVHPSSNKPSIALCKTSRPRWPPWPRHEPWTWALKTEIQSNLSPPLWISKYQILFHFDHIKTFQCWRGNIYRLYSCDNLLRFYHCGEYWPSCWCCLWQSWECRLVGNCPVELLTVYIDKAFLQGIGEDLCARLFSPPCLKLTLVF